MNEFVANSVFFGTVLTLVCYYIGMLLQKKIKLSIVNPILISIILIAIFLEVFDIDFETYHSNSKLIHMLITPATVSLAIPLYEQFSVLKKNSRAIIIGILFGSFMSVALVAIMATLFNLSHQEICSLLPKSVTTAIGMGISEEMGGYVSITVVAIIVTGIIGNVAAEPLCKLFRINEPIAKGVAIGTSSHALGTAKAIEIGEIEGAISSLSIVVCGLMTVVWCNVFALFI